MMKDLKNTHKSNGIFQQNLKDFFSGKALEKQSIATLLPYVLYIGMLLVLYISNGYKVESSIREKDALEKELKDLRAEYITTKSELMFMSKQTEVEKLVAEQGLFKGKNQPIVIKKN